jgi:hypothetical protein
MELLAATVTDAGTIRFTLGHPGGVHSLEGSAAEVERLTAAMREVAALAGAADGERCWLHDVPVGDHVVRLGLNHGGVRVLVTAR